MSLCWNYDSYWRTLLHGRLPGAQHFMHLHSHSLCHVSFLCIVFACHIFAWLVSTIELSFKKLFTYGRFVFCCKMDIYYNERVLNHSSVCSSSCLHNIVCTPQPTARQRYFYHFVSAPFEILGERLQVCCCIVLSSHRIPFYNRKFSSEWVAQCNSIKYCTDTITFNLTRQFFQSWSTFGQDP